MVIQIYLIVNAWQRFLDLDFQILDPKDVDYFKPK